MVKISYKKKKGKNMEFTQGTIDKYYQQYNLYTYQNPVLPIFPYGQLNSIVLSHVDYL